MTLSLPEGRALRCKLVRDFAGSDVEPDLPVVIAILIAQRSVNDRLCSLAGAVLRGRPQVGIGVERRGGLRVAERALDGDDVAAGCHTGNQQCSYPVEWVRADDVLAGYSSHLVTAFPGQFGGVAGPVSSCVSGPPGGGSGGEVEEFGEDCGGDLGGELKQRGASPG